MEVGNPLRAQQNAQYVAIKDAVAASQISLRHAMGSSPSAGSPATTAPPTCPSLLHRSKPALAVTLQLLVAAPPVQLPRWWQRAPARLARLPLKLNVIAPAMFLHFTASLAVKLLVHRPRKEVARSMAVLSREMMLAASVSCQALTQLMQRLQLSQSLRRRSGTMAGGGATHTDILSQLSTPLMQRQMGLGVPPQIGVALGQSESSTHVPLGDLTASRQQGKG